MSAALRSCAEASATQAAGELAGRLAPVAADALECEQLLAQRRADRLDIGLHRLLGLGVDERPLPFAQADPERERERQSHAHHRQRRPGRGGVSRQRGIPPGQRDEDGPEQEQTRGAKRRDELAAAPPEGRLQADDMAEHDRKRHRRHQRPRHRFDQDAAARNRPAGAPGEPGRGQEEAPGHERRAVRGAFQRVLRPTPGDRLALSGGNLNGRPDRPSGGKERDPSGGPPAQQPAEHERGRKRAGSRPRQRASGRKPARSAPVLPAASSGPPEAPHRSATSPRPERKQRALARRGGDFRGEDGRMGHG